MPGIPGPNARQGICRTQKAGRPHQMAGIWTDQHPVKRSCLCCAAAIFPPSVFARGRRRLRALHRAARFASVAPWASTRASPAGGRDGSTGFPWEPRSIAAFEAPAKASRPKPDDDRPPRLHSLARLAGLRVSLRRGNVRTDTRRQRAVGSRAAPLEWPLLFGVAHENSSLR